MFTRCPTCRTLFRIQAQQLKAARGKVRCGECQTTFDALAYLVNYDELSESEQKTIAAAAEEGGQWQLPFGAPPVTSGENTPAERQPATPAPETPPDETPATTELPPPAEPPGATENNTVEAPTPLTAPASHASEIVALSGNEERASGHEPPVTEPPPAAEPQDSEPAAAEAETVTTEAAAVTAGPAVEPHRYILHEEEIIPRSFASRIGWGVATLLMTTLLAGQVIFANRDELAHDPRWRPWLEQACQLAGCTLPVQRDLAGIEMIERTVVSHPKYQHALLITATLLNKAKFAQPYPQVELTMTDIEQKVVASRRFQPREYLKDSDPTKLFAAGGAVQLQLEITDPGEKAVGFEFNFY